MASEAENGARGEAERLAREWEERASSSSRDFFVASHAGWDDPEAWERRARADVDTFLYGLDRERIAGFHVLDVGCGVGRLARPLALLTRSYTGFDISAAMLAEARRRCADLPSARIFQTDGVSVRAELTPEQADLAERADYMGYAFGYAELKSFLKELTGGEATLIRVDAVHIYGWIQRP